MQSGIVTLATSVLWVSSAAAQGSPSAADSASASTAGWIDNAVHLAVRAIEIVGIATIILGAAASIAIFLFRIVRNGTSEAQYQHFRAALGRSILLGLEFLVAADIINTVAIEPTLESVAVLAAIVAVRTFLSFALEVEINGKWPWQQGKS